MIKDRAQQGFLLASLIISTTLIVAIAVAVTTLVINNYSLAKVDVYRLGAQLAADAAADRAIAELNHDTDWSGTAGEVDLHNVGEYKSTYEITILPGSGPSQKIANVTGRTYSPSTSSTPRSTRKYSIDLRSLGSASSTFSIVTGVGGLILNNSAKIVDGDVYVNGTIVMTNTAQIGLSSNPVSVKVANQSCPLTGGSTYPIVCVAEEPISISNPAHIYGDVCATHQSDGSGMSDVGLDTSCADPPPLPLPPHDRDAQKANITTTTSDSYYTNCDSNTAQRTWPGGLKIEGDVNIGKKCEITIEGDVWITGNLDMINSAKIIVSDSISLGGANTVDPNHPTIMIDGPSGVAIRNSSQIIANASDTGAQIITYWSDALCSPDCSDVTGQDLFDSSTITTIYLEQSAQAPSSILYAKWSQIDLNNGGDIGALVGQKVKLRNSAAVTFGTSVGGGGGSSPITWLVDNYRRDY